MSWLRSAFTALQSLSQKTEVGSGEIVDAREYSGQIRRSYAEPLRHGGRILLDRAGRDHGAAAGGVVLPAERERGEGSVEIPAQHGPADHEVMAAPGMVGARAGIRHQR